MSGYLATFHTHAGAIVGHRALGRAGIPACMMPVPRRVSSSCGTCVRFEAETPDPALFTQDLEAIYREENGRYLKILDPEDST